MGNFAGTFAGTFAGKSPPSPAPARASGQALAVELAHRGAKLAISDVDAAGLFDAIVRLTGSGYMRLFVPMNKRLLPPTR